jgi:EAL domain-containing protein (putative c-di-GMP-specific phosphodiesterase class I)
MGSSEKALDVLNSLKKLGISLSTDDFGTGFSSLSYLHRFPFDSLKIDCSFIGQMDSNVKSAEIVRTILMLAQNINLDAIAEGIETEEQLKQLQVLGCKLGQGYLFSKPVDAKTVERLLSQKSTEFLNLIPYNLTNDVIESNEVH